MYRVSDTVRSTHNRDGAIVLDVRQGQMFNLNFVGSRILELLKSGSTESAIVDEISREFGISRELAENDVREFLQNLEEMSSGRRARIGCGGLSWDQDHGIDTTIRSRHIAPLCWGRVGLNCSPVAVGRCE
jgi:hypothetical protein